MSLVADLLGNPSYGMVKEVRPSQLRMAEAVEAVIADGGVCMVEGPVGCGKTFAYLTPALLSSGRRAVVATAKKSLQDQIKSKDLPFLTTQMKVHLGADYQTRMQHETIGKLIPGTVIKGKANYVCSVQAQKHQAPQPLLQWLSSSPTGEWADYPGRRPQWHHLATAEACTGRTCAAYGQCRYAAAKEDAKISKVVVVNHHLLGSDMFYGHGKLVGGPYDILVVDEAHKLADGIRAAFTLRLSASSATEIDMELQGLPWTFPAVRALAAPWSNLFSNVERGHYRETRQPHLRDAPVFSAGDEEAVDALERVVVELDQTLARYGVTEESGFEGVEAEADLLPLLVQVSSARRKAAQIQRGITTMQGKVRPIEGESPEDAYARAQRIVGNTAIVGKEGQHGFSFEAAPIKLGGLARAYLQGVRSVVFTSATLAVDRRFDHLDEVVGVKPTKTLILPPTFDYGAQGFAFVPKDLPHVQREHAEYEKLAARRLAYCRDLVTLSRGGAFVLATSFQDLNDAAFNLAKTTPHRVFAQVNDRIRQYWSQNGVTQSPTANPWFGEPAAILQRYLETPDATLVGAKSFWEGVDVVGEQLRLVILLKLPFPNISDPYVQARRRPIISWMMREQETSRKEAEQYAWSKIDLVDMLVDTRQGVGRLIRSKLDRGVIAILDSRVWTKPYGATVRQSLEFGVTHEFAKCEKWLPRFVAQLKATAQGG